MTMEIQVSNELDRHHTDSDADADATTIKFKGKRTRRQRPPSPLALTMACSSSSDSEARTVVPHHRLANEDSDPATTATTTTTFTTSHDSPESAKEEEEDMANCLILLARGQGPIPPKPASDRDGEKVEASCAFSCKTCGRSFPSFQALGGHRASHKKPKLNDDDKNKKPVHMKGNDMGDKQPSAPPCTALSLEITPAAAGGAATSSSGNNSGHRVHKCSICGAEFSSGQALGGHMRRHRAVMSGSGANNAESEIKKGRQGQGLQDLDLNLPAPAAEEEPAAAEYPFASKEQVLVFSTSPLALVDCHY